MSEFSDLVWRAGRRIIDGHMLCAERVLHLGHYALQSAALPGAYAEFGCFGGNTAAFLCRLTGKPIHLFDSFTGLPAPVAQDADPIFSAGCFSIGEVEVLKCFEQSGLPQPIIHRGFFSEVNPEEVPALAFAHLDGDLYTSILDSLRLVYPKLLPGAAAVVDDYGWERLSGVKAACDDFFSDKPEKCAALAMTGGNHQGFFIKGSVAQQ